MAVYNSSAFNRETLSGAKALAAGDPAFQSLDPDGSSRDVNLPAHSTGEWFFIQNRGGATEDLVVKDDGGSTIATVNPNQGCWLIDDGTDWIFVKTGAL